MVARHEMPGNVATQGPSRRVRYDPLAADFVPGVHGDPGVVMFPSMLTPVAAVSRLLRSRSSAVRLLSFLPSASFT